MTVEKCVHKKSVDRQLRGAAHKRREQDRHLSVSLAGKGAGRHDRRDRAAEADQQGDDAAAGQAELPEQLVHDEGHAGNVAAVLQQGEEKEHRHDDRQKTQHAADAFKDPVDDQPVQHFAHTRRAQCGVHDAGQRLDPHRQKILEPGPDHVEGQIKHQSHHAEENGDRRVLPGQHPVDLAASCVFPALLRLRYAGVADLHDKGESHIGNGGAAVKPALFFHLERDVLQRFLFVFVQTKRVDDQTVSLDRLAGGEAHRDARCLRVIPDQMDHSMKAPVYRASVIPFFAEILFQRPFLILGDMDRVIHQLINALIFGGGDRYDRHAQHGFHRVHVHRAAVAGHLVHHIQRYPQGDIHFQQLHGQIQVALDVGDINDVDDALRLFVQHEVAGDQLLAGVGGHGINARQVGYERVCLPQYHAVLAVDRNAGEIADVLFRTRELIEQRRLAAVLIADQGKSQYGSLGKRIAAAFRMEPPSFAQTVMLVHDPRIALSLRNGCGNRAHFDLACVVKPERQLITMETDLHRIAHRRILHDLYLCAGDDPHIEKMLTQRAAAAHLHHAGGLSFFDLS